MVYVERKKKQTGRQMERKRQATRRQKEASVDSKHGWAKRAFLKGEVGESRRWYDKYSRPWK